MEETYGRVRFMKEAQRRRQRAKKLAERKGKIKEVQETEAGADISPTYFYNPSVTHSKQCSAMFLHLQLMLVN